MLPSGFEAPQLLKSLILKNILVYVMFAALFVLSLAKVPFLNAQTGQQGLVWLALYFWLVFRPNLFPYIVVFAFGVLYDLMSGGTVGLNALCFMVLAMVVKGQRRFLLGQPWHMIWAGYCVAVLAMVGFQGMIFALSSWTIPDIWPVVINITVSCLLYPLFLPVLMLINRRMSQ